MFSLGFLITLKNLQSENQQWGGRHKIEPRFRCVNIQSVATRAKVMCIGIPALFNANMCSTV